jgi:hypothetical protein
MSTYTQILYQIFFPPSTVRKPYSKQTARYYFNAFGAFSSAKTTICIA